MDYLGFVLPIAGLVIAEISGRLHRRFSYARLARADIIKAAYNLERELTPAEFGYILNGKIGRHELAAEIASLLRRGNLKIKQDNEGAVLVFDRFRQRGGELSELQQEILRGLVASKSRPSYDKTHLRGLSLEQLTMLVEMSLIRKGILRPMPASRHRPAYGNAPPWLMLLMYAVILMTIIGAIVVVIAEDSNVLLGLFGFIVALALLGVVIGFLSVLFMGYRSRFLYVNGITRYISDSGREYWGDAKGVAMYLTVSGLDTMTPEYESIELSKLDKLYPYAIALGMDKKMTKILVRAKIINAPPSMV